MNFVFKISLHIFFMFQPTFNLESNFVHIKERHHFHLVDNNQLPILAALTAMLLVINIVFYLHLFDFSRIHFYNNMNFQTAWFIFLTVLFCWFIVVVLESADGYHTLLVRQGLRYGMILFIVSEIMFFFAFFWGFFHVSLSPSIAIGGIWPPKSIQSLDVWGLPLVNTLLLLSSGLTITLAHRALLQSLNDTVSYGSEKHLTTTQIQLFTPFDLHLLTTIGLGVVFLFCQGIEYKYGITFRWKENIYGSTFFVTTGFHGLHVTIGTIFLLFCLLRDMMTQGSFWALLENGRLAVLNLINKVLWNFNYIQYMKAEGKTERNSFEKQLHILNEQEKKTNNNWIGALKEYMSQYKMTKDQHLGFEAAAWYWHFVDVVWIFLFITIYWWGS